MAGAELPVREVSGWVLADGGAGIDEGYGVPPVSDANDGSLTDVVWPPEEEAEPYSTEDEGGLDERLPEMGETGGSGLSIGVHDGGGITAGATDGSAAPALPPGGTSGDATSGGEGIAGCERACIEQLIAGYTWPVDEALRVADCESDFVERAISPDGQNLGVFQINVIHRARVGGVVARLLEARTNVAVAFDIWRDQGWGPWSCKP